MIRFIWGQVVLQSSSLLLLLPSAAHLTQYRPITGILFCHTNCLHVPFITFMNLLCRLPFFLLPGTLLFGILCQIYCSSAHVLSDFVSKLLNLSCPSDLLTSIEMLNLFSSTHLFFCQHHHLQTIHHSMSHISSISSSFHRPSTLISSSVLNHANQLLCQSTCTSSLFFSVQPCIQLTISCVLCFCSSTAAPFFFVILFLQMRSCTFSFHHQNLIVYSPQSRGYTK